MAPRTLIRVASLLGCAAGFAVAPRARVRPVSVAAAAVKKVGIFGGGTVGGGIVEILETRREQLLAATGGVGLEVKTVVVRDASKQRDWAVPPGCAVTESFDDVLDDPEIDVVVEVMGGTTLAKDVVFRALRAKKDVVTANKALIAACLQEIEGVVNEVNEGATAPVQFGYEAAVCGGIPIIHTMNTDFVGDEVTRLRGIMNGCTNFMLTKMEAEGLSYADCLAEATELGYAEEDPTLDVGGFDARSKLAILIRLAFGVDVDENEISCKGIAGLKTVDFEYRGGVEISVSKRQSPFWLILAALGGGCRLRSNAGKAIAKSRRLENVLAGTRAASSTARSSCWASPRATATSSRPT